MRRKRMLLVEDNADDEALTRRALKRAEVDVDVDVAHDGAEAIARLHGEEKAVSQPEELPDVVVLDLKMPGIDGLEVLRRLRGRERTRHLAVVMFTSSNEVQDIEASYRLGCSSYVCKPVGSTEFTEAVGRMAHYWLRLNQAPPAPRVP